jgi:DNA mismatch endonuclease, patch repair protein
MTEVLSKHGFFTSTSRSNIMRKIKSKNTKPELTLRHYLWDHGIRYRLKNSDIVGKPDITMRKKKVAIFVDGEFWHGFNWEVKKQKIVKNRDYWIPKIEGNITRDKNVNRSLTQSGWVVIRFWEKEILTDIEACFSIIIPHINK